MYFGSHIIVSFSSEELYLIGTCPIWFEDYFLISLGNAKRKPETSKLAPTVIVALASLNTCPLEENFIYLCYLVRFLCRHVR